MINPSSDTIRENYDRLAEEYARHVYDELAHKPADRALLDSFAAATKGRGAICDLGCGPGHVARYLHDAGADVFGLDLSPQMLMQARRLNPQLRFVQGDMTALPLADAGLAGVTAFYAIVNLPPETLPRVFSEMARVLQPDGLALLAFHVGDEKLDVKEIWGQAITMNFHLLDPAKISAGLVEAGLQIENIFTRDPYAPDVEFQSRRAYITARKPPQPS